MVARRVVSKRLALGQRGEVLAAEYFEQRGYRVLTRNWRTPEGELDLVVAGEGICIFVEVRSRTSIEQGHPVETIDGRKRARLLRAARTYIDQEHPSAAVFRFDVVAVVFSSDDDEPREVLHVEDAFQSGPDWL